MNAKNILVRGLTDNDNWKLNTIRLMANEKTNSKAVRWLIQSFFFNNEEKKKVLQEYEMLKGLCELLSNKIDVNTSDYNLLAAINSKCMQKIKELK